MLKPITELHWSVLKSVVKLHWSGLKSTVKLHWSMLKSTVKLHWSGLKSTIKLYLLLSSSGVSFRVKVNSRDPSCVIKPAVEFLCVGVNGGNTSNVLEPTKHVLL